MATYLNINGQRVQYLSSDPSNLTEGQIWYNSTSGTAKLRTALSTGVFATAPSLTASHVSSGAAGISCSRR